MDRQIKIRLAALVIVLAIAVGVIASRPSQPAQPHVNVQRLAHDLGIPAAWFKPPTARQRR